VVMRSTCYSLCSMRWRAEEVCQLDCQLWALHCTVTVLDMLGDAVRALEAVYILLLRWNGWGTCCVGLCVQVEILMEPVEGFFWSRVGASWQVYILGCFAFP
jgi:hypothetical protein